MVKPKKHLGQHFLKDESVCVRMVDAIQSKAKHIIEVGPGTGALTKYLIKKEDAVTQCFEVDRESVEYLSVNYPTLKVHGEDFLKADLSVVTNNEEFIVAGNFPYNVSSQILFKVLDNKDKVPEVVGMFQKEVAVRIAEKPGTKKYGIISVLLQAYYDIEYLFTVHEHVFNPPPKVKSGVIRLTRNGVKELGCDEVLFKKVVKQAFNQRRKTMRNSLKTLIDESVKSNEIFNERPEQLSVQQFIDLTKLLEKKSDRDELAIIN